MKSNITYWWCVSNWHLCTAEALWSCYRGSSLGQIEPGARVTGTFSEFSRIIHSGETVRSWTPHLMPWSCVWECVRLKERERVCEIDMCLATSVCTHISPQISVLGFLDESCWSYSSMPTSQTIQHFSMSASVSSVLIFPAVTMFFHASTLYIIHFTL